MDIWQQTIAETTALCNFYAQHSSTSQKEELAFANELERLKRLPPDAKVNQEINDLKKDLQLAILDFAIAESSDTNNRNALQKYRQGLEAWHMGVSLEEMGLVLAQYTALADEKLSVFFPRTLSSFLLPQSLKTLMLQKRFCDWDSYAVLTKVTKVMTQLDDIKKLLPKGESENFINTAKISLYSIKSKLQIKQEINAGKQKEFYKIRDGEKQQKCVNEHLRMNNAFLEEVAGLSHDIDKAMTNFHQHLFKMNAPFISLYENLYQLKQKLNSTAVEFLLSKEGLSSLRSLVAKIEDNYFKSLDTSKDRREFFHALLKKDLDTINGFYDAIISKPDNKMDNAIGSLQALPAEASTIEILNIINADFVKNTTNELKTNLSQYLIENTNPLVKNTNPFRENTNPLVKNTNPFRENTNPLVKNTNSFKENTNPLVKDTNPFRENTNPLVKDTNPFRENTNPFIKNTNPFREKISLFSENADQVLESTEVSVENLKQLLEETSQDTKHFIEETTSAIEETASFIETINPANKEINFYREETNSLKNQHDRPNFPEEKLDSEKTQREEWSLITKVLVAINKNLVSFKGRLLKELKSITVPMAPNVAKLMIKVADIMKNLCFLSDQGKKNLHGEAKKAYGEALGAKNAGIHLTNKIVSEIRIREEEKESQKNDKLENTKVSELDNKLTAEETETLKKNPPSSIRLN